jgi:hypothetical protein
VNWHPATRAAHGHPRRDARTANRCYFDRCYFDRCMKTRIRVTSPK